ncbi:MAG: trypsin-like peptidase domain-containing protein [Planctomycetota bacterium]|nr:trypsin-like peptidase domain-containing protein [Planctomycetota bacterium]
MTKTGKIVPLTALAMLLTCFALVAEADTVKLKSGAQIQGTILKRNEQKVWLDVGPNVLEFNMDDVDSIEAEAAGAGIEMIEDSLFHTAQNLPELSPREQAKRIGSAVIKVSTPGGLGSGVIINEAGYAITNAHVIQGETNLRATVWLSEEDGTFKRTVIEDVEIIAVNNHLDLGLLKITHPDGEPFKFAPIEKDESIEIGQSVFAIGNPLGLERSLSLGVISTSQRSFDGLSYIQTDAAINPGNSGGPLFNTQGEVVGITNMGILGGEALGFAIPARYVKDFIRNREAFAFDKDNPNSGHKYHPPPPRNAFGTASQLQDGSGGH